MPCNICFSERTDCRCYGGCGYFREIPPCSNKQFMYEENVSYYKLELVAAIMGCICLLVGGFVWYRKLKGPRRTTVIRNANFRSEIAVISQV